jgi:hypothetical protein
VGPQFCVYIVESIQLVDMHSDLLQCKRLSEMLSLTGTPAGYAVAFSENELFQKISSGVFEFSAKTSLFPILHLIAHGNPTGIVLFDGTNITWSRLGQLLDPFFSMNNGGGMLCMSSCHGLNACGMALKGSLFHSIIGAKGSIGFSDSAVAFASFYHLLAKDLKLPNAVDGMNAACGLKAFEFVLGPNGGKRYLELVYERRRQNEPT